MPRHCKRSVQTNVCKQRTGYRRRERDIEATDVSRAEIAEAQIATFIARRAEKSGEDRPEEEAWRESVRAYNASKEAERRAAWATYHAAQATRLRRTMERLAAVHENRARQLSSEK
jgi:hypothetical protein